MARVIVRTDFGKEQRGVVAVARRVVHQPCQEIGGGTTTAFRNRGENRTDARDLQRAAVQHRIKRIQLRTAEQSCTIDQRPSGQAALAPRGGSLRLPEPTIRLARQAVMPQLVRAIKNRIDKDSVSRNEL